MPTSCVLSQCRCFKSVGILLAMTWMLVGGAGPATSVAATAADSEASPGRHAVATVGKERVTEADVMAQAKDAFEQLRVDSDMQLRQLRAKQAQARYDLLQEQLQKQLDRRALEIEAKARGTTGPIVLQDIKVPAVSDDEARAYYESKKSLTNKTYEELRTQIVQFLAGQHNDAATRAFYDSLRAKHGITVLLEPYRVAVAAAGPSRGKNDAPISIVEFGDFQCPFCRQAEATLRTVMAKHPDDVRLVFRNLPLASIHANAMIAAEAGVCADHQGMFWQMHDALYGDQAALTEEGLKDTAKRLGLQTEDFAACLSNPNTKSSIDADTKAADELNITGTPFFFINGRPLYGSVPPEKFESVIEDELQRISARRG